MFPTLLSKDLKASESGVLHQPDTGQVEASGVARLQPLHAGHAGRGPGQLPTYGQHFRSDGQYSATLHESHPSQVRCLPVAMEMNPTKRSPLSLDHCLPVPVQVYKDICLAVHSNKQSKQYTNILPGRQRLKARQTHNISLSQQ